MIDIPIGKAIAADEGKAEIDNCDDCTLTNCEECPLSAYDVCYDGEYWEEGEDGN